MSIVPQQEADFLPQNEDLYSESDIRRTLEWSFQPGDTFEIRTTGSQAHSWIKTASGYFQNAEQATREVAAHIFQYRPKQVYCTLNATKPELYARAKDHIQHNPKNTTNDAEIARIRSILIDCDPKRSAGISSSDSELKAAEELTSQIKTWLDGQNFSPPLVAMSGNGYHLRYAVDLEVSDSTLVEKFLKALAKRFDTPEVKVDTAVFNPSRICKLYGTMTRKGDDVPEQQRINRMSCLIDCPKRQEVSRAQLQAIVKLPVNPSVTTNEHIFQSGPTASTSTSNTGDALNDYLAELSDLPSHSDLPLSEAQREHLKTSGLSDMTIKGAEFGSVTAQEAQQFGFPPLSGLLIPYPDCEGYYRLRPDDPKPDEHGRTAKYLSRKGSTNRLYCPPGIRSMLDDTSQPLIITEGEKKALKAAQEGFCAVGLSGVWNWKSADKELIDDLEAIRWKKRRVYVAFDSDIVEKSEVQAALRALVEVLQKRGAEVRVVLLPGKDDGSKVGLDDYLLTHTSEDLRKLMDDAACLPDTVLSFIRPGLGPHELQMCLEDIYRAVQMYPASMREYAQKVHSLLSQCGYQPMPVSQIEAAIRKVKPFVADRRGASDAGQGDKKDPRELISYEVAQAMVAKCYTVGSAQTLRYYKGTFIEWQGTHYVVQRDDDFSAQVMGHLQQHGYTATRSFAMDVKANLEGLTHLDTDLLLPVWDSSSGITDEPASLSFTNGIGKLDELLSAQPITLESHSPRFISLCSLPYNYDAQATCPKWQAFLGEVLENDAHRIAVLQEMFGYCLVPECRYHKFFILHGQGANGKSVVLKLLEAMLGSANVSHLSLDQFSGQFSLSTIDGKLANICADLEEIEKAEEGLLKNLTAGDAVQVDRKYKDLMTLHPKTKLIFSTNTLPSFRDKSNGTWRRLIVVPFNVQIPQAQQNPKLADELKQELPGILNWACQGAARLETNNGFTSSSACEAAKQEHRKDLDPVAVFLDEHVVDDPQGVIDSIDLYTRYKDWAEQRSYRPLNAANFGKAVRRLKPAVVRKERKVTQPMAALLGAQPKRVTRYEYQGIAWVQ